MDKKNTAIGLILLIVGFGLMYTTTPEQPARTQSSPETQTAPNPESGATTAPAPIAGDPAANAINDPAAMVTQAAQEVVETVVDFSDEAPVILENEYVRIALTRKGASVLEVGFKKTDPDADIDAYVFNQDAEQPALGLYFDTAAETQPFFSEFQLVSQTADRVVFQWDAPKGNYSLQRIFALEGGEERPYHITHKTVIMNSGDASLRLPDMFFGLGTAFPLETDPAGQYLNFMSYAGDSVEKVEL